MRITTIILCLALIMCSGSCFAANEDFSLWNDCESLHALTEYVAAVTDEQNPDFIPEEDRIAVFDMDGTLICEQFPIYIEWMIYSNYILLDHRESAAAEEIAAAEKIIEAARTRSIPAELEEEQYVCMATAFAGMSRETFMDHVRSFIAGSADGFDGLTIADAWFRPMKQVTDHLKENGFTVYIVSGTDRDINRVFISQLFGIPARNIIGTDVYLIASGQEDKGYLDYQLQVNDVMVRSANPIIKNVKMSKVAQITQEIGMKPVLAFGNSSGDASMFTYTTSDNPYRSEAFCVLADDDEREYAHPAKVENLRALCEENGWHTISMKNDFVTIYGEGVTKNAENNSWLESMEALCAEELSDAA